MYSARQVILNNVINTSEHQFDAIFIDSEKRSIETDKNDIIDFMP